MRPAPALTRLALAGLSAALVGGAQAEDGSSGLALLQRIDALARQSAVQTGGPGARIEVEVGQLDPRLKLAPCRRDRKSTRLNSSHSQQSRMPSSA